MSEPHEIIGRYAAGERDFKAANLYDANLRRAFLYAADLSGANLSEADMYEATLSGANLSGANLRNADLRDARLRETNLSGTDLHKANLHSVDLYGANLRDASLSDADLSEANLYGAKFIAHVGPMPDTGHMVYANWFKNTVYIQADWRHLPADEMREHVKLTHEGHNQQAYLQAIDWLEMIIKQQVADDDAKAGGE